MTFKSLTLSAAVLLAAAVLTTSLATPAPAQSETAQSETAQTQTAQTETAKPSPATQPAAGADADADADAEADAPHEDAPPMPEAVDESLVTGGGKLFPEATPQRIVDVTRMIFPAVVRLDVAQEVYRDGKRTLQRGIGSGVIFDEEGHILTNYHVAGRAAEIFITLANKERVRARLIGDDHWTDLAVVQLDMDEIARKNIPFSHAQLGTSKGLVPGQDVIAVGTPFGLARTMTLGIVSNTERTFYPDEQDIDGYETGLFSNWIQMDTPIAPGNSGGPLVDLNGEVVGINTRGVGGYNLNFAVPVDIARDVVERILATASEGELGRVARADLALKLKPLQDLETFYEIDINRGVLISSVDRGGPAQLAGLQPQDILLEINGTPTNVRFPEEIAATRRMIARLPVGEPVELLVRRGGQELTLTATPMKLESNIGQEREMPAWGLSVRDVTRPYAVENLLPDSRGVVITSTRSGFAADKAKLSRGDVIRSVNRQPIEDLDAFRTIYDAAVEAETSPILLEIERNRGRRSAVLRVEYDN